jgi:hypothetical protein
LNSISFEASISAKARNILNACYIEKIIGTATGWSFVSVIFVAILFFLYFLFGLFFLFRFFAYF